MDSIRGIVKKLKESRIFEVRVNYSKLSRDELIRLAQDGDQLAIETMIDTHQDFLRKMSRKYILNNADPDDVMQLATIAFWDAINSYDPDRNGDFEAFAGMIIKRKLTDEVRKDSAEKRQINNLVNSLDDTLTSDGEGGDLTLGDTIAAKDMSPEDMYLGKEGVGELARFMRDKFSEKERDVVLRYVRGAKIPKIAEETGMSYKSVENTLMRIRNKLNDYIKKSYSESKKILRREKDIKFSDEEKKVLESVITKINEQESLRESRWTELNAAYEDYSDIQLDNELDSIESDIEEIKDEMEYTDYEDREDLFSKLEELSDKLSAMEEWLDDEQLEKAEELAAIIRKVPNIEYDDGSDKAKIRDPYAERGLRQSDFY